MADAQKIWREGGDARRTAIRGMWPALADALEGKKMEAADIPTCDFCDRARSLGTSDGVPICGYCVGLLPISARSALVRWADA